MAQHQHYEVDRAEFVPLGGDLRGYYAAPRGTDPVPGVVLFQEAFGVNEYIQSEVRFLAEHGYAAIAPDLFRGKTFGYDEFDKVMPMMRALTDEGMLADVRACLAFLDAQANVAPGPRGCVGFCMGGRLAFLCAVSLGTTFAASASFYGGGIAPDEPRNFKPLLDRVPDVQGELLLVYGGDDDHIAPSEHGRLAEALSREKKRYTLSLYPGAPHGFASTDRPSYRKEQAQAAWAETIELFARTLH